MEDNKNDSDNKSTKLRSSFTDKPTKDNNFNFAINSDSSKIKQICVVDTIKPPPPEDKGEKKK